MIAKTAVALALTAVATMAQARCGPEPEAACSVAGGEYHVILPPEPTDAIPVVVFLHGWNSNGRNVSNNRALVEPILARGYAVLAPSGSRIIGDGAGRGWNFYPGWEGRNEAGFLENAVTDAADRFGLDRARVLLAGFSGGGFMVNYIACQSPDAFTAYAPVAGGFWRPHPTDCTGPVRLFHTHGWSDTTVPIEGRYLGNKRFQQGDIFAGLEIWRAANRCPDEKPSGYSETGPFLRRAWSGCAADSALEFALFPGGHRIPDGWADMALDWFEEITAR
ncbi:alpha/beta hydrolase family esterase [Sedimentitalea arenosa]|uniref:Prolyl oligopeptidase family serine peptidase n=1 Tax=Sedimentitalea arenosa TaxID=2798803 RepID=A0A8J7J6C1_9RHOB|nr:PHB depolymerase family esterase [Arenibacterium arenosum]MBJ6371062.1 prolyl oligopeptidase family serine peptidase [Arenibacterium arenosum]